MLPDCSCGTGIRRTGPGLIKVVSERRIGRVTSCVYAFGYAPPDGKYATARMLSSMFIVIHWKGVLTFARGVGSWQYPQPGCVVQEAGISHVTKHNPRLNFPREVQFGASMKHLGNDGEWWTTGFALLLLPLNGPY